MINICVGDSMPNKRGLALISVGKAIWYQKGDVVTFLASNGKKYCHRITRIDYGSGLFSAKGDNHDTSSEYETELPISNIFGRVSWSYPNFY